MLFEAEDKSLQYASHTMETYAIKNVDDNIGQLKSLLFQKTYEMADLEISLQDATAEKQLFLDYVIALHGERAALIVDMKKMQWMLARMKALKFEKSSTIEKLNMQLKKSEEEKMALAIKYDRLLAKQNESAGFDDLGASAPKNQELRTKQKDDGQNAQRVTQQPIVCEMAECKKRFDKKKSYHRHMLRHKTQLVCGECSFIFSQLSDLKRHMLRHTGEKPFSCDLCAKAFSQKGNLKQHLKVRHKDFA